MLGHFNGQSLTVIRYPALDNASLDKCFRHAFINGFIGLCNGKDLKQFYRNFLFKISAQIGFVKKLDFFSEKSLSRHLPLSKRMSAYFLD